MKKKIILILIIIVGFISFVSCKEAPAPTLEPEGTETIITENIIVEETLAE